MNSYKVDASSTKDNSETFLVSFPVPPKKIDDLSFDLYAPIMESTFKKRKVLVAEAGKIEYVGDSTDSQYNCKYAIGILDKTTNKIKLHNATALSMQTIVKKLKNKETRTIGVKDYQARNQLGQAFGTRKRKQAIKAQEQNVVNISGLADVAGAIKDTIAMNAPAQPLKAALLEQSMQDRLIPPCNINAGRPEEVYNIDDICPPEVIALIDIKSLWKARVTSSVLESLEPLQIGSFLKEKIEACLVEKNDKVLLQKLIYLAYLCRFYSLGEKHINDGFLAKRHLNNAPQIVVDHITSQFLSTVGEGDSMKFILGAKSKDKLLAYILCLCLICNSYTLPMVPIATDLKLSVNVLQKSVRELGARCELLKSGDSGVRAGKKATLAIPLSFPKKTMGQK